VSRLRTLIRALRFTVTKYRAIHQLNSPALVTGQEDAILVLPFHKEESENDPFIVLFTLRAFGHDDAAFLYFGSIAEAAQYFHDSFAEEEPLACHILKSQQSDLFQDPQLAAYNANLQLLLVQMKKRNIETDATDNKRTLSTLEKNIAFETNKTADMMAMTVNTRQKISQIENELSRLQGVNNLALNAWPKDDLGRTRNEALLDPFQDPFQFQYEDSGKPSKPDKGVSILMVLNWR
jgi:hypothetical protein